jgi:hypothetical protein
MEKIVLYELLEYSSALNLLCLKLSLEHAPEIRPTYCGTQCRL